MKITSEPFVKEVKDLLQAYQSGSALSKEAVAREILNLGERYYPSLKRENRSVATGFAGPHPMIDGVLSLAFDITVDDWRGAEHIEGLWKELTQTFEDYAQGRWYQTEWYLAASLQRTEGSEKGHTLSLFVHCDKGNVRIECAQDEIRTVLEKAAKQTSAQQTDLRRLENLARFMPEVSGFQLINLELNERLKT